MSVEDNNKKLSLELPVPDIDDQLDDPIDEPIDEIEPKLRLGTLIRRYRVSAGKSLRDVAEHLNVPIVGMGEVERGLAMLKAEQLQAIAEFLKVRYEPLLNAARDWNRAIFEGQGHSGVQLAETTVTERALHGGEEMLERELIRCADDLAFVANVTRELSIKAERGARRARALLRERGVPIPEEPEGVNVECSGPVHFSDPESPPKPHMMRLGIDFVLSYVPPGDCGPCDGTGKKNVHGVDVQPPCDDCGGSGKPKKLFFCSEDCAHDYRVVNGIDPIPEPEETNRG